MEYSQIILNFMAEHGITPYKLAKETGISESLFSKWKKSPTSDISIRTLEKIANYFFVSIELLLVGGSENAFTFEAFEVSRAYSNLDAPGKTVVKKTIRQEQKRLEQAQDSYKLIARGGEQAQVTMSQEEQNAAQALIEQQYPELAKDKK